MISLSDVLRSGCTLYAYCKNMLRLSKKITNTGKCVSFVSNVACSGKNKEVQNERGHVKSFEEIPGPKCYPIVGTLYKYAPFIEYGVVRAGPGACSVGYTQTLETSDDKNAAVCNRDALSQACVILIIDRLQRACGERLKFLLLCSSDHWDPIELGDYNVEALDKNSWLNWRRYGSLVREAPGVRLIHVYDPEDIETVFRQDHRYPARRSHVAMFHYRLNKPHVYNTGGLLSTNGPEWWRLRSTSQKNFTSPQSVKNHVERTDNVITEFVQWIKERNISYNDDFLPYLNRLNLEVIGTVAFNERFRSFSPQEQDPTSRSSKTIKAAFGSNSGIMKLDKGFLWRMFKTPLYQILAESQEYLEKVSSEILMEKAHFFVHPDENDNSLLGSFLKQPNLDLKDVLGMMVDILMAAIDTTAYATSFALYHISRNPEVQQKMFDEISTLLPMKDAKISPDIISKAIYVRSCIKESLRLNPVSIGVGRLTQKDFILRGYLIPEGTVIVTQNMVASRLQQYVNDPLKFKPERWLRGSEGYENIHPFLSLPFGFGPRSCIARRLAEQNICIILIRLIREFNIKWMGGELGVKTLLINKPDRPLSISFISRNE